MKNLIFLFLATLLSTPTLLAQAEYKPGYVIKETNDTLHGLVALRGDVLLRDECLYKSSDEVKTTFTPLDIQGYGFNDGRYFITKEVNGKLQFLEILVKGKLSLYRSYSDDNRKELFFLEQKDSGRLAQIPTFEKKEIRKDGKTYMQSSIKHWGVLMYYMQDAPTIGDDIKKIVEPRGKPLIELTKKYHDIVCPEEGCLIFEGRPPAVQILLELQGGYLAYTNRTSIKKNSSQFGAVAHFSLPRKTAQFYAKMGVLFNFATEEVYEYKKIITKSLVVVRIPIAFEYMRPNGIVRPKLGYGINWAIKGIKSFMPVASAGVNIKLNNRIFATATYDIEFNASSLFIIPRTYHSSNFSVGLMFDLTSKR